jgi:Gas vesicle synthesis protein GvpL/GvpF
VAPVRFGSVMEDEVAVLEELLAPGVEWFTELLAQLDGRVQLNLRASYDESTVLAEVVRTDPEIASLHQLTRDLPPDTAYAERVRLGELVAGAVESRREADTDVIMRVVEPHVVATRLTPGSGVDHVLRAALLVERDRQDELEQALEDLAEAVHERIRLSLVGPVAPYDFVEEE